MFEVVIIASIFIVAASFGAMMIMFGYASVLVAKGHAEDHKSKKQFIEDVDIQIGPRSAEVNSHDLFKRLGELRMENFRPRRNGK
jgi:hypothetical protein